MTKATIRIGVISLRILFFVSIALYVFHHFKLVELNTLIDAGAIDLKEYNRLRSSLTIYQFSIIIFFVVNGIFGLSNKKKRMDGRISLKEYILPEFNAADERESTLSGKAAKAGLAITFAYTALLLLSYVFYIDLFQVVPSLVIFTTASIPIIGLIAYYLSYRYYSFK